MGAAMPGSDAGRWKGDDDDDVPLTAAPRALADDPITWPAKHDLFGVRVSATTYDEAERLIIRAAKRRQSAIVTHLPVHGVVTAARDRAYQAKINRFDLVAPDGQPVRWALNKFYHAGLSDRVYGPELMTRLCRRAADEGIGVYLYGSTGDVVERLRAKLLEKFVALRIVGCESPPFRPLTPLEREAAIGRINASGAGLVFLGLGCPRQDVFADENRDRIAAIQLCVGAAFDFHAGNKRMAPPWMQRHALEWLFRLTQEPTRLWRRYLITNTLFVYLAAMRMIRRRGSANGTESTR
jgi:N-acetylglucosaminyldiphosphoundecaprenol N-acetyl-beta-D-mannosaminyltransferase